MHNWIPAPGLNFIIEFTVLFALKVDLLFFFTQFSFLIVLLLLPVLRKVITFLKVITAFLIPKSTTSTPILFIWESPGLKSRLSPTVTQPYLFTGSMDIQASSAMVIPTASRVPFVLHLPANCQHNCVNTWGSFYCRCRQGYKLQADGKTCEGKWMMLTVYELNLHNKDN